MATQRPQRQNVQTIETHGATAQAMPDDRVLLTLDDGRSFVIDGERINPREDGSYQVELMAADHLSPHAIDTTEKPAAGRPRATR